MNLQQPLETACSDWNDEQLWPLPMMDEWHFDMMMASDVLDMNMIPIVILKFAICYDLIGMVNLDLRWGGPRWRFGRATSGFGVLYSGFESSRNHVLQKNPRKTPPQAPDPTR